MIAIVNVGIPKDAPESEARNLLGLRQYEVRINGKVMAKFQHRRGDGLGLCLLAASKAVEREKWRQVQDIMDLAGETPNAQAQPRRA